MGSDAHITMMLNSMVELTGTCVTITDTGETFWGIWSKVQIGALDNLAQGDFSVLAQENSIFNCISPPPTDRSECTIGGKNYRITYSNPVMLNNVIIYYTWGLVNTDAMENV